LRTPATPSTRRLDPVTETFATRDEVVEWTQRGSAFPKAVETPAAASPVPADKTNTRVRLGVLLAAVVLVTVVLIMTVKRPATPDKPETAHPVSTAPVAPIAAVPASSSAATEPPALPSTATEPPPMVTALSSAERVAVGTADGVTFSLSSDLAETKVTFDGAPIGYAPIAVLKRSAGKHTVTFLSADLGEHLTTSIDAKAGESLKIRAQFKKPDPSIAVRR
jgi:hypothetical protein